MSLTPILADALCGVTHGFFTRGGGVSTGIYAALNGGLGSRDRPQAVAGNRARIAGHLGVGQLVSVHQVHGDRAEVVAGPWPGARPRADAMVTDRAGIGLAILTADCAPVLFADADAGQPAIARIFFAGILAVHGLGEVGTGQHPHPGFAPYL